MTFPSGGRGSNGRWRPATNVERDAIGSNEGLQVGDVCVVLADAGEYRCTAVTGPNSSTWAAEATGGGGGDLATVLSGGNTTGGTNIEISNGDAIVSGFGDNIPLSPGPGGNVDVNSDLDLGGNIFPTVAGGNSSGTLSNRWSASFTNALLVDGAQQSDGNAGADDAVIGDGSGDRGCTVFCGAGNSGWFVMTDTAGLIRAGMRFTATTDDLLLYANGAIQARYDTSESSYEPETDGGLNLGDTAASGWSGVVLTERADHPGTPTATRGEVWVAAASPNVLVYTDDAGNDHPLSLIKELHLSPDDGHAPSASAASQVLTAADVRVLEFADAVTETWYWQDTLPNNWGGGDLAVEIWFAGDAGAAGNVVWEVAFERHEDSTPFNIAVSSFAAAQQVIAAGSGVVDDLVMDTIVFTAAQIDGLQAGEQFRLRLQRIGADVSDTFAGNARVLAVVIKDD